MKDPAFRGLSGNSMGAYGSIMAGLTHPELYSSIGLHMGYLPAEALETLKGVSLETLASYDFYMDAGKQDTTVGTAGTVAIHDYLESIDKEHGYSIRDGGHNSAFYMAGMPASMKMHSDHFQTAIDEGHVTIFFDANGGTASKSFMGTVGGKLTALPAASRSGYNFNGWYTAASGGEKVDLNKVYEETATLYAQWTKITSGGGSSSGGSGGGSSSGGTSRPSTAKPGTSKPVSNKPSTEANDSQQSGPVFNDVPESFWANKEIAWASENGIMNGMGGDRFAPNDTVSRQQLWMVLGRLAGAAPSDMAAASDWAKENGVSDGTMPGGNVSRQQLVAMLYRYAKLQGVSVDTLANISSYPDSGSVANYAKDALAWAIANGIINGTSDGRLNPEGTATRAQFAVTECWFLFSNHDTGKVQAYSNSAAGIPRIFVTPAESPASAEGQVQIYVPLYAVHLAFVGILPKVEMVIKIRHSVVFSQPEGVLCQLPQVVVQIALGLVEVDSRFVARVFYPFAEGGSAASHGFSVQTVGAGCVARNGLPVKGHRK